MAMIDVNLENTQEVGEFSGGPVPPGHYAAMAVSSEIKPVASGRGMRAAFEFEILEGEFKGRKFFDGFNFQHEDQKTQNIGKGRLKRLCAACKFMGQLTDTGLLHRIPFIAKLKVKPGEGEWGPRNEVADYLMIGDERKIEMPTEKKEDVPPWLK